MHIFNSLLTGIGKISVHTSELKEEQWRSRRQERSVGYNFIAGIILYEN